MTDMAKVAWRIVVDAAREAYVPRATQADDAAPIDTRCPGCGLYLDGCESGLCARRPYDDEETMGDGND